MNRLSFRVALLLCAAGLTCMEGCTTGPMDLTTQVSVQRGVYQAQSDFVVVLQLATAYENLPLCAPGGTPLCSTDAVDAKLTAAAKASAASLQTAQDMVRAGSPVALVDAALTNARIDIDAFSRLVAEVKK